MIKRERELAVGLMIAMDEIGMVGVLGGFGIFRIALYGLYGGDGGEFVRGRSAGPAVVVHCRPQALLRVSLGGHYGRSCGEIVLMATLARRSSPLGRGTIH